ncbi:MOSC domain-containing protein [Parathalassolituus penaei]|uniref:MOSC N-terminal beta barrel domain-containing protein n=1 Tax=Parathalassolituus penaei TaxID=2997323 RepID=A0A9X3EGZ5_9GAMM|nr:MOSC N-terminal beta barrel domain-containing protein [Parathalassolituus penaei]MCY0966574.1 MOSC N-terminal beta barrel domain-containing protein [Parathalassolituus penaei]
MNQEAELVITGLFVYPVKSCAGMSVDSLELSAEGVVGDRRYMIVAPDGRFLTQRQLPAMAWIIPRWSEGQLVLGFDGKGECVEGVGDEQLVTVWRDEVIARDCGDEMAAWLESVLGRPCRLVKMPETTHRQVDLRYAEEGELVGFADGFPLLVTSETSLAAISREWGKPLQMERFRPNVVINGGDAGFEELVWRRLDVSDGSLLLVKPCERCVIPQRDPVTQVRDADLLPVLQQLCTVDGKIIFGQNAIARGLSSLQVGQRLTVVS